MARKGNSGSFGAPGRKGGRTLGVPNEATKDARAAIGMFVDGNAHRLQGWLDQIAEGVKDAPDEDGNAGWAVYPNPVRAFELFQSVIEYHVPKLNRTTVSGDPDNPITFMPSWGITPPVKK